MGQELKWADKSVENATFEEWITAFRHADCVVTDSFHGTVFSLKNKKQIVLCGRNDKKAKIASLLHQFDIDISIYNGENLTNYLAENRIDYSEKQKNINYEIEKSMKYLRQALK
ncbi:MULTISPECIES: polysaccharide pyruvyl transferase family protein [Clostridium]|uniref:polysaccharide pyruvyl transferase family protein n=1 Tax=Clostridium TaxID=1485 RepID=UPI001A9A63D8|nr:MULTISPECIES: polysaccharide pyruvyl transferase family protein [Clostridium]